MFSERGVPFVVTAFAAWMTLVAAGAVATEPDLDVSPRTCVSLYRDQPCSQHVTFRWPPLPDGDYCLVVDNSGKSLVCWRGAARTTYNYSFRSVEDRRYALVRSVDGTVLATVIVKRAWVYRGKANSSGGWRVF